MTLQSLQDSSTNTQLDGDSLMSAVSSVCVLQKGLCDVRSWRQAARPRRGSRSQRQELGLHGRLKQADDMFGRGALLRVESETLPDQVVNALHSSAGGQTCIRFGSTDRRV